MTSGDRALVLLGALFAASLGSAAPAQTPQDASAMPNAPIPYRQFAHPSGAKLRRHSAQTPKTVPIIAPGVRASSPVAPPSAAPQPTARAAQPPRRPAALAPPSVAGEVAAPASSAVARHEPLGTGGLEAFVDGVVDQAMADDHIPGVVLSVVQGGRIVLEKGYGAAQAPYGGRPADPRATLFRLGSISKVFTWIAVLQARSQGRLSLDTPVNDILPPALRVPAEGFGAPIRLAQLMSHTAGFEARELGRSFARTPDRLTSLAQTLIRVRPRRVREPGEISSYSNYGAALAGAALAALEHGEFETVVDQNLIAPAGLVSTSFREPYPQHRGLPEPLAPELSNRLARGFSWGPTGINQVPFAWAEGLAPALSASSTAHDMARLMQILLAGGRTPEGLTIWNASVDRALRTPLYRAAPDFPGWTHGLMEEPLPGGLVGLGHDGAMPGFRARLVVVPALDLGVFVAANSENAGALTERLASAVIDDLHPAAHPAALGVATDGGDPSRFEGLYLSTRRAYHGLEGFADRLTGLSRIAVDSTGRLLMTRGERVETWQAASPDRFVGARATKRLIFLATARGRASTYIASNETSGAERVGLLHEPAMLAFAAALATAAALLSLSGPFVRSGRDEARQTPSQAFSSGAQLLASMLHLGSLGAFAMFLRDAADRLSLALSWPNGWLVGASWAALAAVLLTLVQAFQLPRVWRGTRRLPGWTGGRRLRHSFSVAIFLLYGAVAAAWGALEPWSS